MTFLSQAEISRRQLATGRMMSDPRTRYPHLVFDNLSGRFVDPKPPPKFGKPEKETKPMARRETKEEFMQRVGRPTYSGPALKRTPPPGPFSPSARMAEQEARDPYARGAVSPLRTGVAEPAQGVGTFRGITNGGFIKDVVRQGVEGAIEGAQAALKRR